MVTLVVTLKLREGEEEEFSFLITKVNKIHL